MPKFLSQQEVYRILQRELPEEVYADGAPADFFTTADMAAIAKTIETAYSNLERVYENYFPQTADEKIGDWEVEVFGQVSDDSLTLQQRRDRVIAKLLNRPGITPDDIRRAITGALPELAPTGFELIEWGCEGGVWILDVSLLDVDTYLGGPSPSRAYGPDICDEDPAEFGITPAEWAIMQSQAYTYEVVILPGYTLDAAGMTLLDRILTAAEPARSTHVITNEA